MDFTVPVGLTAGAIVSGAYFGDKISPLSDSTNLAPAVTGGELFTHIKHMLWTTVPAYIITAVIFTVIGLMYHASNVDAESVSQLTAYLDQTFQLGIIPLIPIVVLITLLILKKPAIPSIFIALLKPNFIKVKTSTYLGRGFLGSLLFGQVFLC